MPDFDLDSALNGGGYTEVQLSDEPEEYEVRFQAVPIGRVWFTAREGGFVWVMGKILGGVSRQDYSTSMGARRSKEECFAEIKSYHSRHTEAFDA